MRCLAAWGFQLCVFCLFQCRALLSIGLRTSTRLFGVISGLFSIVLGVSDTICSLFDIVGSMCTSFRGRCFCLFKMRGYCFYLFMA